MGRRSRPGDDYRRELKARALLLSARMTKAKSTRSDRTKRAPRDMSAERRAEVEAELGNGTVQEELDELDTDRYEPPASRSRNV